MPPPPPPLPLPGVAAVIMSLNLARLLAALYFEFYVFGVGEVEYEDVVSFFLLL